MGTEAAGENNKKAAAAVAAARERKGETQEPMPQQSQDQTEAIPDARVFHLLDALVLRFKAPRLHRRLSLPGLVGQPWCHPEIKLP